MTGKGKTLKQSAVSFSLFLSARYTFSILQGFSVDNDRVMIQASIYIQYRSQLERTRSDLMRELESRIQREFKRMSGRLLRDGGLPIFEIDERRICFSLELAGTLGGIREIFEQASRDLFGICVLVQRDPPRESVVTLRSRLSALVSHDSTSMIWCDGDVAKVLSPWAVFAEGHNAFLPLSRLSFPPTAPAWPGFWHISSAPELLSSLCPKGARSPRGFTVVTSEKGFGIHLALQELLRKTGGASTVFSLVFGESFHPLHAMAYAIAEENRNAAAGVQSALKNPQSDTPTRSRERDTPKLNDTTALFEELERSRLLGNLPRRMERSVLDFLGRSLLSYARRCRLAGLPALLCICGLEYLSADLEQALLALLVPLAEAHTIHILATAESSADLDSWRAVGAQLERFDSPAPSLIRERAQKLFPALSSTETLAVLLEGASARSAGGSALVDIFRKLSKKTIALEERNPVGEGGSGLLAVQELTQDECELLCCLYHLAAFLPGADVISCLRRAGVSDDCLNRGLVRLSERGFIAAPESPQCISPLPALLSDFFSQDTAEDGACFDVATVQALIERALIDEHDKGGLRASAALLALFDRVGARLSDALFLEALEHDFSRMGSEHFTNRAPELTVPDSVPQERRALFSWLYTGRSILLYSALSGDRACAERFFSRTSPTFDDSDVFCAIADLNRATWFYLKGSLVEAGTSAKQALIRMQGASSPLVLPRLYCQVALIEIGRERIREGLDYLGFAVESAEHSLLPEELVRALSLAAVGEFLWGNLARAERFVRRALSLSRTYWYDEWEDWTRFFLGRILFETGRYRDAIDSFDAVISDNTQESVDGTVNTLAEGLVALQQQRASLCRIWRYRALVHSGALSEPPPAGLPIAGDLGLFTVETLCLRRDYRAALECAQELMDSEEEVCQTLYDRPSWKSGFDWIDNRYLVPGGIRRELLKVFSNLARANAGQSEEAVENMRKMLKEERLSELDTGDAFSYWVYSHCLYLYGAESVDYGTVLSLAFKRFQRRSSRIDDLDTKRAFMSLHRWNAMLVQDAKKANLL